MPGNCGSGLAREGLKLAVTLDDSGRVAAFLRASPRPLRMLWAHEQATR